MEDKTKQVAELYEGAMSLYNTIEGDTLVENGNKEELKAYTNAEDKVKDILNGEEPLFIPEDEELAGMLFQYLNLGYALVGVKYLDMLFNNKNISATAVGYALQVLNKNTEELIKYREKYGELEENKENVIEEKELSGISEN